MSNPLAIATVTEAVRQMLMAPVGDALTGATVKALPPDEAGTIEESFINVYLYQVSPNAALRNADVPTRSADGRLTQRPRAPLDLHYLLTAYGKGPAIIDRELNPQLMLGAVIRALHDQPFLTRTLIDSVVQNPPLVGSDLGQSSESVKLTPVSLSIDELSKLWSVFFQSRYALSVAYIASVIFIEGEDAPSSPLPVQSHRVVVVPSLGPRIESIASQAAAASPVVENQVILWNFILHLAGRGLRGAATTVRIGDSVIAPASVRDDRITVDLASIPAGERRAGVRTVQVIQEIDFGAPSGVHQAFESNSAAFMLAPKVISATQLTTPDVVVEVTVEPDVRAGQRLVLALDQRPLPASGPVAYTFSEVAAADGAAQRIPIAGVAAGTYLVRLRVDGAESPIDTTTPVTVAVP